MSSMSIQSVGCACIESFTDQIARSQSPARRHHYERNGLLSDNTSGGSIAYRSSKAAVNMAMKMQRLILRRGVPACVRTTPDGSRPTSSRPSPNLDTTRERDGHAAAHRKVRPTPFGKFFHYDGSEYPW